MRLEDEASTTDVTSQGPSLQCEEERERQGAVAAAETGVFEGPGGATLAKKTPGLQTPRQNAQPPQSIGTRGGK